jgi:pimeloyl-ACP methyl ester carboxylesterase
MKKFEYRHSGMSIIEHRFMVPLNYNDDKGEKISIFLREVYDSNYATKKLPYLIFFQGGPGYESPRPITYSGWLKYATKYYRVLLLDQRGTGLSSLISSQSIINLNDIEIANRLKYFRADNIVKDAEYIRELLIGKKKWSVLGQSFGGFCATHYLSFYPESLEKVFITGGLPPLEAHADDVYRATYKRVLQKNKIFYNTFPNAEKNVKNIADYLTNNQTYLPNGDLFTVQRFQQLGLNLGFSDGMAILNFLFENAFINGKLSYSFLKGVMSNQTFDTNPIFTILHEACYAQKFATEWSAFRVLEEYPIFKYEVNKKLIFTGEMLYPWMLDIYKSLSPFKKAAQILSEKNDWPILYKKEVLQKNQVPVAAAIYTNDMYVDRNFSVETSTMIKNIKIWETDLYEHNALRSNGEKILKLLFTRLK